MALSAVSSASIAVYAALETSSMQTCKYSQPGPRAAFVAAGLALLACLLAVGIQPSAAGPDALPQKTDVAALTCRDLDADGRPPLPLLWLDGYVSAQIDSDDVYLEWNNGRWQMQALPMLHAQCLRTPDMALTEAWKTAKMHERQEAKAYLGAPCSDLLRLNKKHGIDFRALACWWDGWHGWLERGTYQEEPQEAVTDRGRALEAACKANPRKPLMQILTGLRGHAARPDAE